MNKISHKFALCKFLIVIIYLLNLQSVSCKKVANELLLSSDLKGSHFEMNSKTTAMDDSLRLVDSLKELNSTASNSSSSSFFTVMNLTIIYDLIDQESATIEMNSTANDVDVDEDAKIDFFKYHQYFLLGWLSLFIILFGLVGNLFSIGILMRRQLLKHTINKYLIFLSISDLLSLSIISLIIPLRYILVSHRFIKYYEFHALMFPYLYPLATTFQFSSIFLTVAACIYRTIKVYSYAPISYFLRSSYTLDYFKPQTQTSNKQHQQRHCKH